MSYKLIYTIPFASLKNEACVIEIEKEGYAGEPVELLGGNSPFTVSIDDTDFLYIPSRLSTANIRVVGNDYLQSLFSTAYQQYRVTFKRDGAVIWCGFIKPELYTQDYSSDKFELEIECVSALSTLEYVKYKTISGDGTRAFVSLWELLKKCVTTSLGRYEGVYIPHVYAGTADDYSKGGNVLETMKVSEQDFFDEEDEVMSLKEVLEEICKLLNWTVCDWRGSLYFVDVDHSGEYHKYGPDLQTKIGVLTPNELIVQNIGFAGNDHSLDILPGYNKATVKTSNYPVSEIFPEETFDAVVTIGERGQIYPEPINVIPNRRGDTMVRVSQTPSVYRTYEYKVDSNSARGVYLGSFLYRICLYAMEEQSDGSYKANITEFSYDNCVCIKTKEKQYTDRGSYNIVSLSAGKEVLSFIPSLPCSVYSGGAFCISGMVAQSNQIENHAFSSNVGATSALKLVCKLQAGSMFWNGSNWVTTDSIFKVSVTPKSTGYASVDNTKKLGMPYNGLNGYLITLPDTPIAGSIKFTMYTPEYGDDVVAVYIKDFKLTYKKEDGSEKKDSNSDRYYENVVNEDYVNELDEIEFKISSYNNDGACYSKVLLGDNYLTNNLYSSIVDKNIRPEEFLIQRIVNRYSSTKIKLTQVIREDKSLTPISVLYDNFLVGKKFLNIGGEIDYCYCQFKCIMIENV